MLEITLGPMDQNFEGSLKLKKTPVWRSIFIVITIALWLLCLVVAIPNTSSTLEAVVTGLGLLVAIALLVFYFLSNRVSGLHFAGSYQIITDQQDTFTYSLHEGAIHKESSLGTKSWPLSSVVKAYSEYGYGLIILRSQVIYLPFSGASKNSVVSFINEVSAKCHK